MLPFFVLLNTTVACTHPGGITLSDVIPTLNSIPHRSHRYSISLDILRSLSLQTPQTLCSTWKLCASTSYSALSPQNHARATKFFSESHSPLPVRSLPYPILCAIPTFGKSTPGTKRVDASAPTPQARTIPDRIWTSEAIRPASARDQSTPVDRDGLRSYGMGVRGPKTGVSRGQTTIHPPARDSSRTTRPGPARSIAAPTFP